VTLLYLDPIFTQHETGSHPENAGRVKAIAAHLEQGGWLPRCERPTWEPATAIEQHRVHTDDYTRQLASMAAAGGGLIERDTLISSGSWDVTCHAAGAACDAVTRVCNGHHANAFCVVRPPGHHALSAAAMGFCLLNNVAIAARHAVDSLGLDRVMIIDWDVHHGNGTQAIFYDDPSVAFYSIHRWPFYPGTGDSHETGTGDGLGTTANDPVTYGTTRSEILKRFARGVESLAQRCRPQLILVSAGFDAHRLDPIGSLGLESDDFATMTETLREVANQYCDGRIVSLLEGGYHPAALAQSVGHHLESLLKADAKHAPLG
jgi:acetoin utilization deacetylase AcuC-like enzyme